MSQSNKQQTVEELEKEISKILRSPQRESELVVLNTKLRELRRRKPRGELAMERDRLENQFRKLVDTRSRKLQKQIPEALDELKRSLAASKLPTEDWTGIARTAIKELDDLDLARDEVGGWRTALNRLEREREDLSLVLGVEEEIKKLWARAKSTEEQGGYGDTIVVDYKDALTKIQGHLKGSKVISPAPKRKLEILAAQAERLLNESADRHTLTLTRAAGNEVVAQFKIFLKRRSINPDEPVTYFLSPDKNAGQGQQPVKLAVDVAREHVRQFWNDKVTEYVDLARHLLLDDHDPYGAQAQLDKCQDLEGLNDPEILKAGLTLDGDPQVKIKRLQTEIDAKRTIRQSAEASCQKALNKNDLPEAYTELRSAEATDNYTPAIKSTRLLLQERRVAEMRSCADSAESYLNEGRWDEVSGVLATANQLSALDPAINLGDIATRLQSVRSTLEDVCQLKDDVEKLDPTKAGEKLEAFKKRYPTKLASWEEIRQIQIDLDIQLDAHKVLSQIRGNLNANASLDQLKGASAIWDRARPKIDRADLQKEFDQVRQKLDAWLGYRTAENLKSTDLAGALEALQPVVLNYPEFGGEAKRLRDELETQKNAQQNVEQALANIQKYVITDPRLALEHARNWKTKASFHTSEFVDLELQAQTALENQLGAELDLQLAKSVYSKDVRDQIDKLINELEEINSEKKFDYRKKSELPCAIAEAEEEQKKATTAKSNWASVATAWNRAHDFAIKYHDDRATDFWAYRLEAYKKQIRDQAMRAEPAEQIDLYRKLNSEVNEVDAEVWLWLGQAHLESARQMIARTQSDLLLIGEKS